MRTGFTGVKIVTAVAIFLSGCLLLYHTMADGALGQQIPAPGSWLAIASVVLVAAVAVAWTRSPRPQSALMVALAMLGTQFVLLISAGIALEATRPEVPGAQLVAPLSDGAACLLAAMLTLAAWLPLRSALTGERDRRRLRAMRARGATPVQRSAQPAPQPDQPERGFVLGVPEAESGARAGTAPGGAVTATDAPAGVTLAVDCEIEVPVPLVFSQLHQAGAIDDTVLAQVRPDLTMNVPVSVITPGLREGEVALPFSALAAYLPKGVPYEAASAESGEMMAEPMILIPLEMIVPQIPPEAFAPSERAVLEWLSLDPEQAEGGFALSALAEAEESD